MVGHNHNGFCEVLLYRLEFALDFGARERVERAEWFVHQQNGWVGGECSRNPNALALSAGKFVGIAAQIFPRGEADEFHQLRDARTNPLFGPTLQTRQQRNILFNRIVRKKPDVLNDVADLAPQRDGVPIERGAASDAHFSAGWLEHAID